MKKSIPILCLLVLCAGCKKEQKTETIIVKKPVTIVRKAETQEMGAYDHSQEVAWVNNATYTVVVARHADKELPQVSDEQGNKYYDNTVTLKVVRADGSEFYNRTFRKTDFIDHLDSQTRKVGALLGIVFVRADGDDLVFSASVGSPDPNSDEYIPMSLRLSRMGVLSVSTASLDENEEEE